MLRKEKKYLFLEFVLAFVTYVQAKRIVKFVTDVGATINSDPEIGDLLEIYTKLHKSHTFYVFLV